METIIFTTLSVITVIGGIWTLRPRRTQHTGQTVIAPKVGKTVRFIARSGSELVAKVVSVDFEGGDERVALRRRGHPNGQIFFRPAEALR